MEDRSWADQRREAAAVHAERLARRTNAEHARARALLRRFTDAAIAARLPSEPLVVQGFGGKGRARSDRVGWYLRADRTIGLGADGELYRLTAPLSLVDRLRGVHLEPMDPPMVLGAGGKDGQSIDLAEALERLLPGWQGTGQHRREQGPGPG